MAKSSPVDGVATPVEAVVESRVVGRRGACGVADTIDASDGVAEDKAVEVPPLAGVELGVVVVEEDPLAVVRPVRDGVSDGRLQKSQQETLQLMY